ncbi:unnamed protein product [Lactuca virosa]|uniref:Uncharacterized protein n=1 Tax=Lactuca virosa TaxID=75947 RepID=A0AAU9PDF9_9ASTR|nr:unnamed protein product [Lactuca virosa]
MQQLLFDNNYESAKLLKTMHKMQKKYEALIQNLKKSILKTENKTPKLYLKFLNSHHISLFQAVYASQTINVYEIFYIVCYCCRRSACEVLDPICGIGFIFCFGSLIILIWWRE